MIMSRRPILSPSEAGLFASNHPGHFPEDRQNLSKLRMKSPDREFQELTRVEVTHFDSTNEPQQVFRARNLHMESAS